jgi:stress response protein YsnF
MINDKFKDVKIPIIEEKISIDKAVVTTGSLHVKKSVEEVAEPISATLTSEAYEVYRVAKNEILEHAPEAMYQQNDTIIIPVVEERLVVEKRLILVEEIHMVRRETKSEYNEEVKLRKEKVTIERKPTT